MEIRIRDENLFIVLVYVSTCTVNDVPLVTAALTCTLSSACINKDFSVA